MFAGVSICKVVTPAGCLTGHSGALQGRFHSCRSITIISGDQTLFGSPDATLNSRLILRAHYLYGSLCSSSQLHPISTSAPSRKSYQLCSMPSRWRQLRCLAAYIAAVNKEDFFDALPPGSVAPFFNLLVQGLRNEGPIGREAVMNFMWTRISSDSLGDGYLQELSVSNAAANRSIPPGPH
jgi:hypothetical protein